MRTDKRIFWLEDDLLTNQYHIEALKEHYSVTVGAGQLLVDEPRVETFDLLIVDLMIHPYGPADLYDAPTENLHYAGVPWRIIGIEFLRRVRVSEYLRNGFPASIPVVVLTGVGDDEAEEAAKELAQGPLLSKPCTIDVLLDTIASIMARRGSRHA